MPVAGNVFLEFAGLLVAHGVFLFSLFARVARNEWIIGQRAQGAVLAPAHTGLYESFYGVEHQAAKLVLTGFGGPVEKGASGAAIVGMGKAEMICASDK